MNKFFGALAIFLSVLVLVFFGLAFTVGWWADTEPEYKEYDVIGKIKIQYEKGSDDLSLVFHENEYSTSYIISYCDNIYYDSLNNTIITETIINENKFYDRVDIINALSKHSYEAVNKKEITEKEFKKNINNQMKKWSSSENE